MWIGMPGLFRFALGFLLLAFPFLYVHVCFYVCAEMVCEVEGVRVSDSLLVLYEVADGGEGVRESLLRYV